MRSIMHLMREYKIRYPKYRGYSGVYVRTVHRSRRNNNTVLMHINYRSMDQHASVLLDSDMERLWGKL